MHYEVLWRIDEAFRFSSPPRDPFQTYRRPPRIRLYLAATVHVVVHIRITGWRAPFNVQAPDGVS